MDYENEVKAWTEMRKKLGITQEEISTQTKMSQQMVSAFESLKRKSFPLYFYYRVHFGTLDKEEMPNAQND